MISVEELKKEVDEIKQRNQKVEIDKRWETSWTRKICLIIFTYISIGFYLQAIKVDNPWLNAIVPALAFYLSTLTLPFIRRFWEKYQHFKA